MSTEVLEIRLGQNVNMYTNRCVIYKKPGLSVCKYHWSYCNWALYCNLTIVMIPKAINNDPLYEYSPWLLISATLYNKKIVIFMLNCYCRKHLIFLCFLWHWHHGWCSIRYTHFKSLSRRINWVVGDSFYNTTF